MFVEERRARREQGVLQGLGSPLLPVASEAPTTQVPSYPKHVMFLLRP